MNWLKYPGLLCSVAMIAISFHATAQDCKNLVGTWINQDSSILIIESDGNGIIKGNYQSNASDDSNLFAFSGMVNRHHDLTTLSFTISWAEFGSITSWTGYCEEKEEQFQLKTMWHLVRPYVEYDWERFVTNTSIFTSLTQ